MRCRMTYKTHTVSTCWEHREAERDGWQGASEAFSANRVATHEDTLIKSVTDRRWLAGWLSWLEHYRVHREVAGSIPRQGIMPRLSVQFLVGVRMGLGSS